MKSLVESLNKKSVRSSMEDINEENTGFDEFYKLYENIDNNTAYKEYEKFRKKLCEKHRKKIYF